MGDEIQGVAGSDRRRLRRWNLVYYLRVFDESDGSLIGHIVDINADGLMIVGSVPVPVERYYSLWIELPKETGERQRFQIHAQTLWCRQDDSPDLYATGMRLVRPTPEILHNVQTIIGLLGF